MILNEIKLSGTNLRNTNTPRVAGSTCRFSMFFLLILLSVFLLPAPELPGEEPFRLALLPLVAREGVEKGEADALTILIGTALAEQGGAFLQIVEAPKNEELLSEQRFQLSGLTSGGEAFDFGRRVNANMILTGFTHRAPEGLIAAILLYDTGSGRALAARSFSIREEALESDISSLVGQIITDLQRSQHTVSPEEVQRLIDSGRYEEAYRLYPLLDPADPELELLSGRLASLRSDSLEKQLSRSGDLEELFLYLSLSRDLPNEKVLLRVVERERAAREAEIEEARERFTRALKDGRFDAAEKQLGELKVFGAEPELVAQGEERLHQARWKDYLQSARLSLIRREGTSAAYYSVEALKVAPLEEELLKVALSAERLKSSQRERELYREGETAAFTYSTRSKPMIEIGAALGLTHDPLAKRSYRGLGYGFSGGYRFYRELAPPLSLEQGIHLSWNSREGELASELGTRIDIKTDYLELVYSLGLSARFAKIDFGAGLRAGAALFMGKSGEDDFIEPALSVGPELLFRYFVNRHLSFGAALNLPSYLMPETPGTGGGTFSLQSGWSF